MNVVVGARLGEDAGLRRRRLLDRARDRRHRLPARARRARRRRRPRTPHRRSAAGRWSQARVSEADERERHRASRTTRRPCSSSAWATSSSPRTPTATGGARRAPGCRSPTWAAARTTTLRSSPPLSRPGELARELLGEARTSPSAPSTTGKLFEVTVERWNGREREIVEHPGAVRIVAVDREGYVTLVRQFREATGGELLELPAGTREPGEEPLETARRELAGGDRPDRRRVARGDGVLDDARASRRERMTLFFAEGVEPGEASPEEDESFELVRWPVAEIEARLGEIEDAKSLVGLLLYLRTATALGSPRREDRGRQGDQARRVPRRTDAGGRARARPARARGVVETGAGEGSSFPDAQYEANGARIGSVEEVWASRSSSSRSRSRSRRSTRDLREGPASSPISTSRRARS